MPGNGILILIAALEMKDARYMTQIILKLEAPREEAERIEGNKPNDESAVSE